MAEQTDDIEALQQLKQSVRTRFSKVYASLMAREKETLDQLDAIYKYLQKFDTRRGNCVRNLRISYDNEATILNCISGFGTIDLQNFNFDSGLFQHEYIKNSSKELESTSIHNLTKTDSFIPNSCNCCCHNRGLADNLSNKECTNRTYLKENSDRSVQSSYDSNENKLVSETSLDNKRYQNEDISTEQCLEAKVKDSTQEWLDSIKDQVETEPCQVSGELEHSALACL